MLTSISVIKRDDSSTFALNKIFNSTNIIACANYDDGTHCSPARTAKKIDIWGKRGDDAVSENQCMLARIINVDSEPAAMFNIGITGNTVIDRTQTTDHSVYEISGLMVRDEFLKYDKLAVAEFTEIAGAVKDFMRTCKVDDGYTKVFATFLPTHPYQESFLSAVGAVKLTTENIVDKLGSNSLHPERFKFEGEQLQQCSTWSKGLEKASHEGWADSDPCASWTNKTAYVFDIVPDIAGDQHIYVKDDL